MVGHKDTDSVQLQVSGPKSVLPYSITACGTLAMTWLQFLNETCGLQLDNDSDHFICTSKYSIDDPKSGWAAHLNDKIQSFISKFSRKQSKYCLRLRSGSLEPQVGDNNETDAVVTDDDSWIDTPTPAVTVPVRKFASIVPLKPHQLFASGHFQQLCKITAAAKVFNRHAPESVTPIKPITCKQQLNKTLRQKRAAAAAPETERKSRTGVGAQKRNLKSSSQTQPGSPKVECPNKREQVLRKKKATKNSNNVMNKPTRTPKAKSAPKSSVVELRQSNRQRRTIIKDTHHLVTRNVAETEIGIAFVNAPILNQDQEIEEKTFDYDNIVDNHNNEDKTAKTSFEERDMLCTEIES